MEQPADEAEATYRVRRADLDRWVIEGVLTAAQRDSLFAELTLPPPPPRVVQRERRGGARAAIPLWARPAGAIALTLTWLGLLCAGALTVGPRLSLVGPASQIALLVTVAAAMVIAGVLLRRVVPLRDLLLAGAVPLLALAAWGVLTLADVVPSVRAVPNYYVGRYSTPDEEAGVRWGPNAAQRRAIARARQGWRVGIEGAAMLAAIALAVGTRSRVAAVVASGFAWLAGCDLLARVFGTHAVAFWLVEERSAFFALGSAALVLIAGFAIAHRWRGERTVLLCGLTATAAALLYGAARYTDVRWLIPYGAFVVVVAVTTGAWRWRRGLLWAGAATLAGLLMMVGLASNAWGIAVAAFFVLAGAATLDAWRFDAWHGDTRGGARRGGAVVA